MKHAGPNTLLFLSTTLTSIHAFAPIRTNVYETSAAHKFQSRPRTTVHRPALIYGWDGEDDDECAVSTTTSPVEKSFRYDTESDQCSVEGMEIAETISYDPDRLGSLARLAVAFSPKDQTLQLDQIERVEIMCVSQKHIDLQAIICEGGGCLSLAVPIQFPKACDMDTQLEGCVVSHLADLDENSASVVLAHTQVEASGHISWDMAAHIDYPSWWIHPTTPQLVSECQAMCSILNDDEFQPEVLALVREAMKNDWSGFVATEVRVARISPAGFCFKAKATAPGSIAVRILDVFSPFPGSVKTSVDELRATILGTVATAA